MSKLKNTVFLACLIFLLVGCWSFTGAEYREEFSKTLPLKAGETFSLANVNGSVHISCWDRNQVEIKAVKIARRSEEDLEEVEIRVDESAGKVAVEAVWPRQRRNLRVSVDFTIKVPEGVRLREVRTINGGVEATGEYESAELRSTNGSVTVDALTGDLDASTTNGGVRVYGATGRITAESTNGNIKLEGITFRDGIRAGTTNGSITVAFASQGEIHADLLARTTNGSISVDLPVVLKVIRKSKRLIEAEIGEGGPEILLKATNGSIRITK